MNRLLPTVVFTACLLGACNQASVPATDAPATAIAADCTTADPNRFPNDAEVMRVATAGDHAIVATAGSLTCTQASTAEANCVLTGPGMAVVSDFDQTRMQGWSAAAGQTAEIHVNSSGGRCSLRGS